MGEIFHGQTKGYMFGGDKLHDLNISEIYRNNRFVRYFTFLSKTCPIPRFKHIYNYDCDFYTVTINLIGEKID